MSEQQELFNDPTVARVEQELFGDEIRPTRPELDVEGDFLHGLFVEVERNVDLKTGYAPVDVWTFEAIEGALAGGTKRAQRGRRYALAAMHVTLRNRLAELDPQPSPGERIAVRRGREFVNQIEDSPGYGNVMTAWQVVMPDRPKTETETKTKTTRKA